MIQHSTSFTDQSLTEIRTLEKRIYYLKKSFEWHKLENDDDIWPEASMMAIDLMIIETRDKKPHESFKKDVAQSMHITVW